MARTRSMSAMEGRQVGSAHLVVRGGSVSLLGGEETASRAACKHEMHNGCATLRGCGAQESRG